MESKVKHIKSHYSITVDFLEETILCIWDLMTETIEKFCEN